VGQEAEQSKHEGGHGGGGGAARRRQAGAGHGKGHGEAHEFRCAEAVVVHMERRRMRWREGMTNGSHDGGLAGGEGDGRFGRLPCRGVPQMALRGQSEGKEG
jgi:hypothetical protein